MQSPDPVPIHFLTLQTPGAFDTVTTDDIEQCRRDLGLTPLEFAEHLGWSLRKYQRTLEAAREDGFIGRDTALAARGLVHVLLGADEDAPRTRMGDEHLMPVDDLGATSILEGRTFPSILCKIREGSGKWTAEVTPHLFRLVAKRANNHKLITYGEAATTLEDKGLTKRVWPRTLYSMPLGAICNAVMILGRDTNMRIPLLSAIVVSAGGEPGPGLDGMIKRFVIQHETAPRAAEIIARIKRDRSAVVKELQAEVFAFPDWLGVLTALGLE